MADIFNPQANNPFANNYLGYSKGVQDKSLGTFASGIAQDLDVGLKAIDQGVSQMAQDDVTDVVNATDKQLLGVSNQPPAKDPLSDEVTAQVNNLRTKKLAMDAGTMDASHYYATIMAKTKEIRARYSGYNDQIDQQLKQMGIDPNWQRKQILEEGDKAAARAAQYAHEEDKNRREFVEANGINNKYLIAPPDFKAKMVDPNFYKNDANMAQLKGYILSSNQIQANVESKKLEATYNTSDRSMKANKLEDAYGYELQTTLHSGIVQSGAWKMFQDSARKADEDRSQNGGVVSAEDSNALALSFSKLKQESRTALLKVKQGYTETSGLFPDGIKRQDELYGSFFDTIEKDLTEKNTGGLMATVAAVERYTQGKAGDILQHSEVMRSQAGARAIIGDQAFGLVARVNGFDDPIKADVANSAVIDQITGKVDNLNQALKDAAKTGYGDAELNHRTLDNSLRMIAGNDAKANGKIALAKSLYDPKNQGFWDSIMSDPKMSMDDKRAMFSKITSPVMAKAIIDLDNTYGGGLKQGYYGYASYMFAKLNQASATDVNDTIQNSTSSTIKYDPITKQLSVVPYSNGQEGTVAGVLNKGFDSLRGSQSEDAVKNLNAGIRSMLPIWKEEGINPDDAIPAFIQRLGIDLDAPKQEGLIDRVSKYLNPGDPGNTDFAGPRGSPVSRNEGRPGVSMDTTKANPSGFYPRGNPQPSPDNTVGDFLQNLNLNPQQQRPGPSHLGGPGSAADGNTQGTSTLPSQEQLSARAGILQEIKDVQGLYNTAEDPAQKARYGKMLDDLHADYTGTKAPFQPRGNPAPGVPTDEQQAQGRNVIDAITGFPSFVDAVKSGDPKEIAKQAALAMANVIPFPGARVAGKAGEEIVSGGAKIIDNVTREARGAAKGLEKEAAKQSSAIQELKSVDVTKLSDEGLKNVEDQLRQGLASKSLSNEQASAILDKVREVSDELSKRTSLTPAEETMRASNLKTLESMTDLPKTGSELVRAQRSKLVENGIATPEQINTWIQKNNAKYVIVDKTTKKVVDTAQDLKSASRKIDNRDNKYGSYNFTHYKIDE